MTPPAAPRSPPFALLAAILALAFALRVGLALALPNVFAPDEIFQTLEPAHRLAFGEGIVTWEYRSGARSWIVPALLAVLAYLGDQVSSTPSGYLAMVRVALCALSLIPVAVALLWGWRRGGVPLALLAGGICAFWFDLLFFAPKALNEVFGAHLLLLGLWLGLDARGPADGRRLGTAAAICAAAACIRLQLAPAVVVALFGIGWPARRRDALVLGALAPVVLFGLVDWLTWGAPFHSYWENYYANVIDGRSHLYGWLPKYQYLLFVWHAWLGPTAVAMVVLAAVGAARERLLACVALAIVVPHSFLGHKEYRYLYSAIPFGLLLVARGAHLVALRLGGGPASTLRWAMGSLGAGMLASLLAALDFTEDKVPTGMAAQERLGDASLWTQHGDEFRAMQWLGTADGVHGIGLAGIPWVWSGGYTALHRSVPLFLLDADAAAAGDACNYVVAAGPLPAAWRAYSEVARFGGIAVYHRPGPCAAPPAGYHVNRVLAARGE